MEIYSRDSRLIILVFSRQEKNMKDYEKIGQMLYLGYKEKDFSKFIKLLGDIPVGGIIFFEENFTSSSYIKVIEKVKKKQKLPVFIGLDQEGGRVQR